MANNAILFDLMTLIKSSIENRGLIGISSANVIIVKEPVKLLKELPTPKPWPGIVIAPWGAEELNPMEASNSRDDVYYPIVVAVIAADNGDQQKSFNKYLFWRQSVRQLFHDQQLPNNTTSTVNGTSYVAGTLAWHVYVRPLDIVDRQAWRENNQFASGLLLRCKSRETRG